MASSVPNAQSVANQINGIIASKTNVANGLLGLDANGDALATLIQRFGTASQIDPIVLANGQAAFTTDTREIRLGDGITPGGVFIAGGSRVFGTNDLVTMNSTSTPAVDTVVPVEEFSLYRIKGMYTFLGDTDNLSNFRVTFVGGQNASGGSGLWSSILDPLTANAANALNVAASGIWSYSGAVAATSWAQRVQTTVGITIDPGTLNQPSAELAFEIMFASGTRTSVSLRAMLRTPLVAATNVRVRGAFEIARLR